MCLLTRVRYKLTPPKIRAATGIISFVSHCVNSNTLAYLHYSQFRADRIIRTPFACQVRQRYFINLRNEDLILRDLSNLETQVAELITRSRYKKSRKKRAIFA